MREQSWLGLVLVAFFTGCDSTPVLPPPKAVPAPTVAPIPPVDPYKQFKAVARMAIEDIRKPVTPKAFDATWKLVGEQYQALRLEGKAAPASDVYDRLDHLRVVFDLHWRTVAISQGPFDHAIFEKDIATIEKLIEAL